MQARQCSLEILMASTFVPGTDCTQTRRLTWLTHTQTHTHSSTFPRGPGHVLVSVIWTPQICPFEYVKWPPGWQCVWAIYAYQQLTMACNLPYSISHTHGSNLAINFGFIPLLLLPLQQKKVGLANPKIYDKWPEHISTPKDRSCKTNVQLFLKFDSCRHVKASLRGNVQFSIKLCVWNGSKKSVFQRESFGKKCVVSN